MTGFGRRFRSLAVTTMAVVGVAGAMSATSSAEAAIHFCCSWNFLPCASVPTASKIASVMIVTISNPASAH